MPEPRDPRIDPQAGDVVIFGPQWQTERYEVIQVDFGFVRYRMGSASLACTIDEWREWAASGEVLD